MTDLTRRRLLAGLPAICALGALAACGKKGRPRPPEGEEASYTYPRFYPNKKSVEVTKDETREPIPDRENEVDTSPFSWSRETTRTYGPE